MTRAATLMAAPTAAPMATIVRLAATITPVVPTIFPWRPQIRSDHD